MRLRNWQIDGFGVFLDAELPEPGLGDGFNLVVGPNEAGKSTLLDFLRYTLFGHPSGHSRLPRRVPLRGGNHSGMVVYEVDTLIYNLHRDANNKKAFQLRQNGDQLTEDDLAHHLGHIPADVFRNLFGFSLAELQDLNSLAEGDVRNLIFAASIGRTASTITKLQDSLSKQASVIFREGARPTALNAPRVIKLRHDLDSVERQLAEARQASRNIPEKLNELEDKKTNIRTIGARLEEVERDLQRLGRLTSGWPLWVERCYAEQERNQLGDVSKFPVDGDTSWAIIHTEFQKARELAQTRFNELNAAKGRLNQLPVELPLLSLIDHVNQLGAERSDYDFAVKLAVNAKEKAAAAEQRWNEISAELGATWPEDVVRGFDNSLLSEDEARRLSKEVANGLLAISDKRAASIRLAREARSLSNDCASAAKRLDDVGQAGTILSPEEIARRRTKVAEFREALRRRETLRNDLGRAEDHLNQVKLFSAKPETQASYSPRWLRPGLFAGSIMLAIAAVALFFTTQQLAGAMSAAFALVLLALAFLLASRLEPHLTSKTVPPELKDATDRYAAARKEAEKHESQWQIKASEADISWPVSESELTAWESRIAAEEQRSSDASHVSEQYQELRDKRRSKYKEFHEAKDEFDQARRTYSNAAQEWNNFLSSRSLPETIQSETAIAVFSKVKDGRRYLTESAESCMAAEEWNEKAEDYIDDIKRCLEGADISAGDSHSMILGQFERLRELIDQQEHQLRERQSSLSNVQTAKAQLKTAIRSAKSAREKVRALLQQMGVRNEQELADLSKRAKRYSELTQTINQKDTALGIIFGSAMPDELLQAWHSGSKPDWDTDTVQFQEERETLLSARESALRGQTALEIEIKNQFDSDAVALLQLEAEQLGAEIRKGLEDWLELATALELLKLTREKFEKENQSPALDEASQLFRAITGGRYERIFIPLDSDEAELTILTQNGTTLGVDCLSRGTLEQLLLCIRLGYIQHFQRQQKVNLPLLMDDVAVNFDPERMARALEVLAESSRQGQQVIFLTCHDSLINSVPKETRIFRLRDFKFEAEIPEYDFERAGL